MAYGKLAVAMGMIALASPVAATQSEPTTEAGAPAAPPEARYCLHVEPITGSRIETIRCETREGWAELEINVDKEWAKEGVKVIG